jgi:hypothetical protein
MDGLAPQAAGAARSEPAVIEAHFKLTYPGFTLDVDLTLPGQGITALFGHSGSGKTTLLRAIAGLERVPDGQPFRRCPGPRPRPAGVGADQGRGPDRMRKHFLSNPEMSLKGVASPGFRLICRWTKLLNEAR